MLTPLKAQYRNPALTRKPMPMVRFFRIPRISERLAARTIQIEVQDEVKKQVKVEA